MNSKLAFVLLLVMVIGWAVASFPEIFEKETYPDYTDHIEPFIHSCSLDKYPERDNSPTRSPLKWYLICLSFDVFQNERVIPYIISFTLIISTFVLSKLIIKHDYFALIPVFVLITSGTFIKFDTSATYDQTYSLFVILSFIFAIKSSRFSLLMFGMALLSKMYAMIFFISWLLFELKYKTHDEKMISLIGLGFFIMIAGAVLSEFPPSFHIGGSFGYHPERFLESVYQILFYFTDSWIIMIMPVLIIALVKEIKNKTKYSGIILFTIIMILTSVPLVHVFTDQIHHVYRFTPLIIFLGIALSMVLTSFGIKRNWIKNTN